MMETAMQADSVTRPRRATRETTNRQPATIATVMLWELRCYMARRSSWLMLAVVFGFFVFLMWFMRSIALVTFFVPEPASVAVSGTSAWGMVRTLPRVMVLAFGMFLPFLAAGGVARDLKQRTHEIVMSTPVPTRSYVWGRYLAVLAVGLCMALLMLLAIFLTGYALHLGTDYPPPNMAAILSLWATVVLPAMVLITSVCFVLGTLLPRFSNPVKVVVLTAWFLSIYLAIPPNVPTWYPAWDPTSRAMSYELELQYKPQSEPDLIFQYPKDSAALEQMRQTVRNKEQVIPDLVPWVPPKLAYIGLGFLLVALVSLRFQRFRNV